MSRNKVEVGSAPWILCERQQADQFVEQEVDEFSYSVRNEMEWLNEHMAEIFTRNQLNVADVFKTPGKLRGKTPRTVRKRHPLETRAPLTDIFAPNTQTQTASSPSHQTQFYKQIEQIQIAEDPDTSAMPPPPRPEPEEYHTSDGIPPGDSGYHGMTEDEMDVDDDEEFAKPNKESPARSLRSSPPKANEANPPSAEGSFVSAREDLENQTTSKEGIYEDDDATVPDDEMDLVPTQPDESPIAREKTRSRSPQYSVGAETVSALNSIMHTEEGQQMDVDGARTPSDGSSPAKPLLRKSSLTFSSLPAREPLGAKKSMGNRTSHVDQYKARASQFGRFTGGKSLGGSQALPHADTLAPENMADEDERPGLGREESETTKMHNKTSTQRLHDRINMLAQSQESRTTKSIPSGIASQEPNYPQLPPVENDEPVAETALFKAPQREPSPVPDTQDDDDDWIAPISSKPPPAASRRPALRKSQSTDVMEDIRGKSSIGGLDGDLPAESLRSPASQRASPARPGFGHSKSKSVPNFNSPSEAAADEAESGHKKLTISISNPNLVQAAGTSTPAGSPKRHVDGPLSASKSRLYSVLKSAKSIFASSAGVSAQAKLEALSPPSASLRNQAPSMEETFGAPVNSRPLSSVFDKPMNPAGPANRLSTAVGSPSRANETQKTRGSIEREQKQKEKEIRDNEGQEEKLEKARGKELQKAAAAAQKEKQKAKSTKEHSGTRSGAASRADTVSSREDDYNSADEMPPPPAPKAQPSASQAQKPRSRLVKPSKDTLLKPRTHIKVGLGSQRTQPTNADLSKSLQGSLPPPSKASTEPASNPFTKSTGPSAATVAKPNSLALAAKNKEKEEREAQRKAEKKRVIEQQRAAKAAKAEEERRKADEERKAEAQRKAAEQQRVAEAKRAANRQAMAAEVRKQEQMRTQAASRQANDLTHALQQEKASTMQSHPRGDMGTARPISRMNTVQDLNLNRPIPPVNPAKPPKRMFHVDDDEPVQRPQAQRNPPSFQHLDAKRRKTLEEEEEPADARRSMMAPPIRQSNVRKAYPDRDRIMSVIDKAKEPSKFAHGYMVAPGPSSHASMFKQTVTIQHQVQHGKPGGHPNDMATISKAKIPFAGAPTASSTAGPSSQQHLKTPMRGNTTTTTVPTASPHFPTPELPEIATDSEDEDSDSEANNFQAPSWVNSPALRELLTQQQLVDPLEVFGPIAPLQMEEIFKNKDRHKRFRDRTSSANWNGNDRLTEDERRKDREGRERLMRDGGWTFGNAP